MATKVQCKSYFPGYYSMRDLNEDSNSGSWSLYYGDHSLASGQHYNGFWPRNVADVCTDYNKDVVKQTMLEHEAVFRNQVYELHRLYRIQRDLMDEIRRKEFRKHQVHLEPLLSSSSMASQRPTEDSWKWHLPNFAGPSVFNAENIHSPLNLMKGKNAQASPIASESSKDCEVLGSRPTKVRRKMFDLQLPADEYIDTEGGDRFADEKGPDLSSYHPGNCTFLSESSVKQFLGSRKNPVFQEAASSSTSCLRSTKDLGDLNEPIQVEETSAPASVDLLGCSACHGEFQDKHLPAKPKSNASVMSKEILQKSHHENDNGFVNNQLRDCKVIGKDWLSSMLEAGHNKGSQKPMSQSLQQDLLDMSSQPLGMFNRTRELSKLLPDDRSRSDGMKEKVLFGLEISERNHDLPNYNQPTPHVASQLHGLFPFAPSSDLGNATSQSILSKEKPCFSLSQQCLPQTHLSSSSALDKNFQNSAHCHENSGFNWRLDTNSKLSQAFKSVVPIQNGFYNGSSSGAKEPPVSFPSAALDLKNYKNFDNVAAEWVMSRGSAKYVNGSNFVDLKSGNDLSWNIVLSNSSTSGTITPKKGLEFHNEEGKHEGHGSKLPWLRAKPACKIEAPSSGRDRNVLDLSFYQAAMSHLSDKIETRKGPIQTQNITSALSTYDVNVSKNETCTGKILGVPIFENPDHVSKNESSFTAPLELLPQRHGGENITNNKSKEVPDINLASDLTVSDLSRQVAAGNQVSEEGTDAKIASVRGHIDLNSCISEEDALLTSTGLLSSMKVIEIDLEAPVAPESDEDVLPEEDSPKKQGEEPVESPGHKTQDPLDEFVMSAAEAIVSISSSRDHNQLKDTACSLKEASSTNTLQWFVEIAFSCIDDLENKLSTVSRGQNGGDHEPSFQEMDYFEIMTLRLREVDVEEYPSKTQIADNPKAEDIGTTVLANRRRKGQARRGRQRRDFQRDILPGLASLSRHEVTEDLQTFGGLMKAMGHSWHSGPTRRSATRNGCTRGRRRLVTSPTATVVPSTACAPVQQIYNIEVGLEERSLTGWGKTTRRPRRQRCPPGNSPAVPII